MRILILFRCPHLLHHLTLRLEIGIRLYRRIGRVVRVMGAGVVGGGGVGIDEASGWVDVVN